VAGCRRRTPHLKPGSLSCESSEAAIRSNRAGGDGRKTSTAIPKHQQVGVAVSTDSLDPVLVSRKKAASLLSISLRAVDYLIARREIRTRRIGKRVLIHYDEIKRYAKADHPKRIVPEGR